MRPARRADRGCSVLLALLTLLPALVASGPPDDVPPVPEEEYPIYDEVVRSKYLTSQTTLVVIQRLTTNRLQPGAPPVSRAYLEEQAFFEGRLPPALTVDFVLKNTRPARLEPRFDFGVRYRLVSEGEEESEVDEVAAGRPARLLPLQAAPATIGRLCFSRVGFAPRRDRALVYVAEDRPDGTGGGLLVLLGAEAGRWRVMETEVLWMARPGGP